MSAGDGMHRGDRVSAPGPLDRVGGAWARWTRGNGLELAFVAGAVACLAFAVVATVRAGFAEVHRDDLRFDGALDRAAELIDEQGARGVAAYRRAELTLEGRALAVDSLAVTGDSLLYPSLAEGGFLRDQVDAFNAHAARRAVQGATGRGERALEGPAPSIFRLARTDSGFHYLSSALNRYALVVPSPFADRLWRPVRTADWRSGPSLLGQREGVSLLPGPGVLSAPRRLNHEACRVKGADSLAALVYCRSAAGAAVNEAFDLRIDLFDRGSLASGAELTASRRSGVWWNGERGPTPRPLRAGDLIAADPVGPALLSDLEEGVLAGPQWLNGRMAAAVTGEGTLRAFGRAGRGGGSGSPMVLSLNAALSGALDREVDAFVAANHDHLDDVVIVVADLASGEVRAISQAAPREGRPVRAFEPLLLGSMVKPLLAAAILSQDPRLAGLRVAWAGPEVARVGGVELRAPFANPLNGCPPTIGFADFLRCSSNQYAVELVMRSLEQSAGAGAAVRGRSVPNEVLEGSALTNGLLSLFDDVDVVVGRQAGRSDRLWRGRGGTGPAVPPADLSLWPWTSRPWYIDPEREDGTPVDWLARFAFGGWENRWTLLGAAEAYARIATGRDVDMTIVQRPGTPDTFPALAPPAQRAMAAVRTGLRQVARYGTAAGLEARLAGTVGDSMVVLAKTGTLNEITPRRRDDDVFVKSLAMVVGRPSGGAADAAVTCGLVVTTLFEFRQDWRERARGGRLPDLHTDFAGGPMARLLRDAWPVLAPCDEGTAANPATGGRPNALPNAPSGVATP